MPVRVLAFHAAYACRHAGACCSAGWPIPIERAQLIQIERGVAAGRLFTAQSPAFLFPVEPVEADAPALAAVAGGRCVFRTEDQRCSIHETLGHEALPLACRQFPRVTVHDPRGAAVTLSHYCPTAGAMLDCAAPDGADIVVNPTGFPEDGEYVGLDARDALPPLLDRDLLMDWDSWWRLEELAVGTLLHQGTSAHEALAVVRGVARRLRHWRPGPTSLIDEVHEAFESGETAPASDAASALVKRALEHVPALFHEQAHWTDHIETTDGVTRRFLAAHAFANWHVHQKDGGLPAWLDSIETASAFLSEGAGVRQADLVLRHLAYSAPMNGYL